VIPNNLTWSLVLSARIRGSLVLDRLQDGCPGRLAPVRLGIYLRRRFCSDPIEVRLIAMSAAAAGDRADMAFILACHLLERARDHLYVLVSVANWMRLRHRSLLLAQVSLGPDDHGHHDQNG